MVWSAALWPPPPRLPKDRSLVHEVRPSASARPIPAQTHPREDTAYPASVSPLATCWDSSCCLVPVSCFSTGHALHGVPASLPPPPLLKLHGVRIDVACPCGEACRMGSTPPNSIITVGCESLSPEVATIITASPFWKSLNGVGGSRLSICCKSPPPRPPGPPPAPPGAPCPAPPEDGAATGWLACGMEAPFWLTSGETPFSRAAMRC